MEIFYLLIVGFLLLLAVFDLFVGVTNDAVNFLNSAIGAKVAKFRTVLLIASLGVAVGALLSAGMMDVARHGILMPANYSFHEVMIVFLGVMVTEVVVLDAYNSLGLPTSTTISLVFGLLGGTFVMALLKMVGHPEFALSDLLNSDKALTVIVAIFVSVAIAFLTGTIVQWLTRIVFSFNLSKRRPLATAIFGGISFTVLTYFIFIKGLSKSPFMPDEFKAWILGNTLQLVLYSFVASTILSTVLYICRVNVFRLVVLTGTFALAMAFACNDLVNFIGVPLAGLDSYRDWMANGTGDPHTFMMTSLMESAKSPLGYLLGAGVIMILAISTSKKAQNVVKTAVDLSRQDEGDEMFGTSRAARSIVRFTQDVFSFVARATPKRLAAAVDARFNKEQVELPEGAAFDVVRAAINLVLSSTLIVIGTNYKLPLSTTYVTFMVAMGSSLADRAWSRESAVFRVTGVMSVIGGWFVTAGVTFIVSGIICLIMYYLGFVAMFLLMALVIFLLVRSHVQFARKEQQEQGDNSFTQMLRCRVPETVWEMLRRHISQTQSQVSHFVLEQYDLILSGLSEENIRDLRAVQRGLSAEQENLKKTRRKEFLAMRRIPQQIAIERNTWFHLGANCNQQYIYCLKRMLEPVKEHVDNNFNPLPRVYRDEFAPMHSRISELMTSTAHMLSTLEFHGYRETLAEADRCKDELSVLRLRLIDRMHSSTDNTHYKISLVYLNILQESQELLSIMRHQLRAGWKLLEETEEMEA